MLTFKANFIYFYIKLLEESKTHKLLLTCQNLKLLYHTKRME